MSITKDFESLPMGCMECGQTKSENVDKLLAYARALEVKLEWALDIISDEHGEEFVGCPTCDGLREGRKLLESVE